MNEIDIIEYIRDAFKYTRYKFNDDVAYLPNKMALKVDMLVGSTDAPPGISFFQIGKKAVVSTISDFGVKGVRPLYGLLSYAFPRTLSEKNIKDLIDGTKYSAKKYGLKLVGGDVNESKDLIVDCIMLGSYKRRVTRNGAQEGDLIYATGEFGLTKAGLDHLILKQNLTDEARALALKQVYDVEPPFEFSLYATERGLVDSSMDSSDGLAYTLNEMAFQSNKTFILDGLPISDNVSKILASSGRNVYNDVMFGGEEYQMVMTVKPKATSFIEQLAKKSKVTLHKIGCVVNSGPGVYFKTNSGDLIQIPKLGWINLSNNEY